MFGSQLLACTPDPELELLSFPLSFLLFMHPNLLLNDCLFKNMIQQCEQSERERRRKHESIITKQ